MLHSSLYVPDQQFARLGPEYSDPVRPADFPQAAPRFWNQRWAERIGLGGLSEAERQAYFGRFEPLPGVETPPLAMRYHGHQFRSYNPELGDGRGFLYAQLRDDRGRLLDLGTKGSGKTPWSRTADGRLTLKGGMREVLAASMLEALGVPTSKAFALYETGEQLVRGDEPSPTRSAVLTRLSHSHIRFGTFQRHAFHERADLVSALTDHVIETYYPALRGLEGEARAPALLAALIPRVARMTARWMAAGFVHGVLNTDNMNLTGESFDYGPYRFLPKNDPGFTAAYFDSTGLYAFGRQPEAVFWNLQRLAAALSLIAPVDPLIEALNTYGPAYRDALAQAMVLRLGLRRADREAEIALAEAALRALAEGGEALRWEPFFFDWFGGAASEGRALAGPRAALYAGPAFMAFRGALEGFQTDRTERLDDPYFARPEPEELLYDEIEQLWAAIAEADDWRPFQAKLERIEQVRTAYAVDPVVDA